MMSVLLTGGSGYIGSHTVLSLINNGYKVTVIDNLSNSSQTSLNRIQSLLNCKIDFINCDLRSYKDLDRVFSKFKIDSVIHFAALKAVHESISDPLRYYENNAYGTINLLKAMEKYDVRNFIFSSSATVYGKEAKVPYKEDYSLGSPTSPYAYSKVMIERFLQDQIFCACLGVLHISSALKYYLYQKESVHIFFHIFASKFQSCFLHRHLFQSKRLTVVFFQQASIVQFYYHHPSV